MKKVIHFQTQNLTSPAISKPKDIGWCALNFDNIRLIVDAYDGSPFLGMPRENSVVRVIDDRHVHELTSEQLLEAVKFYKAYHAMGSDVVCYRNLFQRVLPDLYKNACKQRKKGLEF